MLSSKMRWLVRAGTVSIGKFPCAKSVLVGTTKHTAGRRSRVSVVIESRSRTRGAQRIQG